MANCKKCGKSVNKGVKFCPSCGAAVTASRSNTAVKRAGSADVEQNKTMAIVAYFLFFVPLLTGDYKKSEFLKFHTNQATVLCIASVIGWTASSILIFALFIGLVLMPLVGIASLVLFIIGIINVVNGRMQPLPIIGKFTIIQ